MKRVALLLTLFSLLTPLLAVDVAEMDSFPIDVKAVTQAAVEQELAWILGPDDPFLVEVQRVTIDKESFEGQDLYRIDLLFKWEGGESKKEIAFLSSREGEWQALYTTNLKQFLRLSFARQLSLDQTPRLDVIVDAGYWSAEALRGRRFAVIQKSGERIAVLEATDRQAEFTELIPLWASRPLAVGMPLERLKGDYPLEFSPRFSGDNYGFSLTVDYPLYLGSLRLSQRLFADLPYSGNGFTIQTMVGVKKVFSLGALLPGTSPLGRWWTNIQLGAAFYLGCGATLGGDGELSFSYGTSLEAVVRHQSSANFYWGLSAGYKYGSEGVGDFLLSPVIGWLW
ncbi:MAG: hypothetical protein WC224_00230 [Sphaerochaetaceae bacterium]